VATPAFAKNNFTPAHGSHPGTLVVTATWTTYAQGGADKLDLSALGLFFDPKEIVNVVGVSAAGHSVVWTPNATPTMSDAGGLSLFNGTTQATAGALATTARLSIALAKGSR
jgi:hypothetical protein